MTTTDEPATTPHAAYKGTGEHMFADDERLKRVNKLSQYPLNETQRAVKTLFAGDQQVFLTLVESPALSGKRNTSFAAETGVVGNFALFTASVMKTRACKQPSISNR